MVLWKNYSVTKTWHWVRRLHRFWAKRTKIPRGQGSKGEGPRHLQQQAFPLPLLDRRWAENGSNGFIEHCLEATLCEGRALQVFYSTCRETQPLTATWQCARQLTFLFGTRPNPSTLNTEHYRPCSAGSPKGSQVRSGRDTPSTSPDWTPVCHKKRPMCKSKREKCRRSYRSPWPWLNPAGRWWASASSPSVSQSCLCHP